MRHSRLIVPFLLVFLGKAQEQDITLFETHVRPVLATKCHGCHGKDQQLSGLRLDSREALLKGGARGPSVVVGDPAASLLVKSIRHQELKMPVGGKLKDHEILAFEEWIRKGAVWPAATTTAKNEPHWAFQKISVQDRKTIDTFISDRLTKAGLKLAKPADKRTLIRRLNYVLTGLPPAVEEVDRFVADNSPDAYERLVDRALASPRFGEHWARHWLDLVRYGETRGYEWNYEIIGAWRYRDYLIRALNADVPYDQLVREHIAGDLLEKPRVNVKDELNESVIGTAFYRLGEAGHDDCVLFREIALDVVDNQIDTLTKAFQGLTVSCARCHNHKLDPIPTEDYYGLYSILNSSRAVTHTIDLPERNAEALGRLRVLKQEIRQEMATLWLRESKNIAWQKAPIGKGQKMESPGYPLETLHCQTGSQEQWLKDGAAKLAISYKEESAKRTAANRENFQALGNWQASGQGLKDGFAASGDFAVASSGDVAISGIFERGTYTHLLSSKLNGALRSPDLPKDRKYLSVRVMGGSLAARRVVIDNCAIGETYKVLENDTPEWVRFDTLSKEARLPVFAELVTRSDNPRIPDRPGVLKPHQAKLLDSGRSYFGFTDAVLHDGPETPKESLSHMLRLFDGQPIESWKDLNRRYEKVVRAAVENWAKGSATNDDARWLDWATRTGLLTNRVDATSKLRALISEYRRVEEEIREPRVVEGLADMGPGKDYPVLIGGGPKNFGQPAPRRYLLKLFGETPFQTKGSGRLQLADVIASPDNPLTARVMVNRIWSYVFGGGMVASVDDFGMLGDRPSHPELLDSLAAEFIGDGWSIKKLTRRLLTSETFKQSGEISGAGREVDPENRLLHHYPLRRLEAESIRDSILISSGKLKDGMFGPSIDPFRDEAKDYRRLFAGPLDGGGRRSLYLKVTRMEGTKFLDMFDYPNANVTRGSRDVTNVPAQALTLLNDPFVIAEAEECARRLLGTPAKSIDERVAELFRTVLGRAPTAIEIDRFRGLASELGSMRGVSKEEVLTSLDVWKDLAHAAFNMKEFIYVQ